MPNAVNGIGTLNYGKCDFGPDGSFVTTTWFACLYVPLFPVESQRILETSSTSTSLAVVNTTEQRYLVLHKTTPDLRQVLRTWSYLVGRCALAYSMDLFKKYPNYLGWIVVILVWLPYFCLPYVLRKFAIRRMRTRVAELVAAHEAQTLAARGEGELPSPPPAPLTTSVVLSKLYGEAPADAVSSRIRMVLFWAGALVLAAVLYSLKPSR